MVLIGLFVSAFLSATLLPGSSEVLLGALVSQQTHPVFILWLCATFGNVLGSCVNYYLGTQVLRVQHKSWFPVSAQSLEKAQKHFARYGTYSLLLAWLPVVGDPLTCVAGVMRVRFSVFLLWVSVGKAGRYAVVIALAQMALSAVPV